jgi:hypothetical protein
MSRQLLSKTYLTKENTLKGMLAIGDQGKVHQVQGLLLHKSLLKLILRP